MDTKRLYARTRLPGRSCQRLSIRHAIPSKHGGGRLESRKMGSEKPFIQKSDRKDSWAKLHSLHLSRSISFPCRGTFLCATLPSNNVILYPRAGYGNYMRDDVLNALDWCRKYKIPIEKAVIMEEANFFHPARRTLSGFLSL